MWMKSNYQLTKHNTMKHTKNFLKEENDKESRRQNITIYNMPESKSEDIANKQKDDKEIFLKLINDVLEISYDENDLKKIFRIGVKEDGKVKPLLIKFNMTLKNLIMESLYKLAEAKDVF